jgi:RNA polymerase sigma-70 factor, ECF subfamily
VPEHVGKPAGRSHLTDDFTAKPDERSELVSRERGESASETGLSRLMAGYQAGDAASFDALYAALAPGLRRYLITLTRDAARAEDLLQETFLRMHKVRHTYDPSRPVEPWAYAIARHVFLMAHRRARRSREAPLLSTEYTQPGMTAPDVAAVSAHELARALDALPRDRREAVVLHHLWGFRFDEIATRLGIQEGAARLRAHRGIKALRQLFKRDAS